MPPRLARARCHVAAIIASVQTITGNCGTTAVAARTRRAKSRSAMPLVGSNVTDSRDWVLSVNVDLSTTVTYPKRTPAFSNQMSLMQRNRVYASGCLWGSQFTAGQPPLVDANNVPLRVWGGSVQFKESHDAAPRILSLAHCCVGPLKNLGLADLMVQERSNADAVRNRSRLA